MKTIYTTLPIYDSVTKQDYNRTGAIIPIYTPRHRLPSWQFNAEATTIGNIDAIYLINLLTGVSTDISTYFPTLSDSYVLTTDTYYKYDGDTLNYLLPYGVFYLKISTDNSYIYYSEIFTVTDIYEKLVTSWTNVGYNTFVSASSTITSAIETGADGRADSNSFQLAPEESITAIFYLTRVSGAGTEPTLTLHDAGDTDASATTAGLNVLTFTAVTGRTSTFRFTNGAVAEWSITEFYCIRNYSPDYIRIDFHDTHDLGDIVYQSGFTQSLWLATQLNTPQHEPVMVGDEKDGIFIAEKIVTKWKYRIVTYVGPVFYKALIRLPQHDDISIIDEVGFTYTPKVGNVQVSPINWTYFDTGTLEIVFNDNSEFIWTSEKNNLT